MEPLSALSIASAVIQIVDFSSKVISRTWEVYQSADGSIEEITLFEDATSNLEDLVTSLGTKISFGSSGMNSADIKTADLQLLQLAREVNAQASDLRETLKKSSSSKMVVEGALSIKACVIKQKLNELRKQVDTTLLVAIRQGMTGGAVATQKLPKESYAHTERKAKLLATVQGHDWQPTTPHDLAEFSKCLVSSVDMDIQERFSNAILGRLYFADMSDRYDSIPKAHRDTFQWIFNSKLQQHDDMNWDSFSDWLTESCDKNVYWATGKPGSGKSTLMKFIFNNTSTQAGLESWSKERSVVKAGFFFWNSGTVMQMSREGLLRSLLHTSLSHRKESLVRVFQHRWQQFVGFGGGRQPFIWSELRQAFETMISAPLTPQNFFFVIDGLDEFDGNPKELIELLLSMAKYPYVKICLASRPWLVFSDAFADRASLRLEDLTRNDVQNYINSFFTNNQHYARLAGLEPVGASALISDIADKSAGVFLWVYLVVQSLLDGLSNADRLSDLILRLRALPPGLEELYDKLLNSLDADYLRHACQLFRLVAQANRPHLLYLYFADNEDEDSAMREDTRNLSPESIALCLEAMDRRLMSRCKGFLEVDNRLSKPNQILSEDSRVGWIHRTARDFLVSETTWQAVLDATGHDAFDVERREANAAMGVFKAIPASLHERWDEMRICVDYAILLEYSHKVCPVEYLNELVRSMLQKRKTYLSSESSPGKKWSQIQSSLDFAVHFRLVSYINAIGPTVTREELNHARETEKLPSASRSYLEQLGGDFLLLPGALYIKRREERETESRAYYALRSPAKMKEALLKITLRLNKEARQESIWGRTKKKFLD